jgi:hypothetical protein
MIEQWRPIAGADGFEVSDQGNVRTWWDRATRSCARQRRAESKPVRLTQITPRAPYVGVCLPVGPEQKPWVKVHVHVLVLETFVGPRPSRKHVARHVHENDRRNNALSNLAWGTQRENIADQLRHGTAHRGERTGNATIDEAKARRVLAAVGTHSEVARTEGVSYGMAFRIRNGTRWAHLSEHENRG